VTGLHPEHRDNHPDRNAGQDLRHVDSQDPVMVPSPRDHPAAEVESERQAAAAAVVAEAVALALEAAASEAAEAVLVTADAVTAAAGRAAEAAESARAARAFAADAAAQSVAREALRSAAHVRERAEVAAAQVQRTAALIADELAHSIEDGTPLDAGRLAILLEATVRAAADATAEDTTRAANAARYAEAAAAAQATRRAASAAQVVEREVAAAAQAQRDLAAVTAAQVASQTDARAAGVAIAAREAAAALIIGEQRPQSLDRRSDPEQHELAPTPPATPAHVGAKEIEEIIATAKLGHDLSVPLSSMAATVRMLEVALRESDNRFQFLIDAVTEYAIMTLSPDGVIESWNTGAERLKGYSPQEALGRHFSIFYTAEDRDAGLPESLLARARAEGSCENTGWRVRKDGSQFWGDIIISAVHDDTGNLTGYVKVTRDLTEQHRLEIAQDSFYYAFEHDFQMPITAIKGFAEMIRNADPEDQGHLLERVNSNADRLLGMVAELVDYARLRSGLIPINLQTVDLMPFAQIAVANLAATATTSRVHVTAATPVTVLADPAALERVIANLVTNALKYSPSTSDVHLICDRVDDVGVLRIVDQGRGIDERDLGSIFLEFERSRLAQNDTGTGLGLASVQRLVDLQHGTVWITSQVQVGTTVTLRLPLAPRPASGRS
jgi:PAS domain S-box-containing protein